MALSHLIIWEVSNCKALVPQYLPNNHFIFFYLLPSQSLKRDDDIRSASAIMSVAEFSDVPGVQKGVELSEGPWVINMIAAVEKIREN